MMRNYRPNSAVHLPIPEGEMAAGMRIPPQVPPTMSGQAGAKQKAAQVLNSLLDSRFMQSPRVQQGLGIGAAAVGGYLGTQAFNALTPEGTFDIDPNLWALGAAMVNGPAGGELIQRALARRKGLM
ncbi:hypothetical protein K9N68_37250 (plasmid) [Kovacikia minuta CCNUW1]|uniref:hypothetical protein n=1 Tax=Kovacikia minuta TaxID=2931930 RepID=UPI001CCC4154|nr:hypothetical protein [Kovacikia minuta]UBF29860.1 hypothetical protein K9N68_37250 [Kovacikia minuta CCNUW1]